MNKVTIWLTGETPSETRLVVSVVFENSCGERVERFWILTCLILILNYGSGGYCGSEGDCMVIDEVVVVQDSGRLYCGWVKVFKCYSTALSILYHSNIPTHISLTIVVHKEGIRWPVNFSSSPFPVTAPLPLRDLVNVEAYNHKAREDINNQWKRTQLPCKESDILEQVKKKKERERAPTQSYFYLIT